MSFSDDYRALQEGAALGETAPRGRIAVAGRDRATYLQGLLTNDIVALTPGTGCYAAWLTPQGRMLTDLHVLESGDMILLDVPADQAAATLQRLDQFLFSEDVQLADLSTAIESVSIHGPSAAVLLERTLAGIAGLAGWSDYQHAKGTFGTAPASVVRLDQVGVPGYCVYLSPDLRHALVAALERAGAAMASPDAMEAARLESGYPLFGIDMDTDTIPLEAGIEARAISLTKGCYVGQEVIIRVLHRGHGRVAKRLVTLRVEGEAPHRGAVVHSGEKEIGRVTSAAVSPRFGTLALAYVHRDFVEPGTAVMVDMPAGPAAATVRARP